MVLFVVVVVVVVLVVIVMAVFVMRTFLSIYLHSIQSVIQAFLSQIYLSTRQKLLTISYVQPAFTSSPINILICCNFLFFLAAGLCIFV
jgi:hypothetical protein